MRHPRAARPVAPDGADKAQDPSPDPVNNESLLERERAAGLTRDLKTHVSFLSQGRFDGAWSAMADDMEDAAQAITTLLSRAEAAEAALQTDQAELKRMREADGWQPIETAPKDGEPVLLYAAPNAEWDFAGLTDWCYWDEGSWIILSECEHDCFRASGLYSHWLRPMPPGCRRAALQQNGGGDA